MSNLLLEIEEQIAANKAAEAAGDPERSGLAEMDGKGLGILETECRQSE